ncbi:histone H3-like centromeric protein A [Corythoichthys intestinalis]|uniref:histone H3-like centromeric protein A n=1 Tax=Corythoichthys intestinalis TaxID=161448 RepID=UPI0025A4E288|nr:histone H3-like centromeric protein A [Corythoichthys intestinalis]XP_061809280.1 histone H3-like centromeric protein A [Nerophis lumbriciformis]
MTGARGPWPHPRPGAPLAQIPLHTRVPPYAQVSLSCLPHHWGRQSSELFFVVLERSPRIRRFCPGTKALMEIHKYQKSTRVLFPQVPFLRLFPEVCQTVSRRELKWQVFALMALQEAAEAFLVLLFGDANLCAIHAKRVTLLIGSAGHWNEEASRGSALPTSSSGDC